MLSAFQEIARSETGGEMVHKSEPRREKVTEGEVGRESARI